MGQYKIRKAFRTVAKSNKMKFILINANQDINLIQDIIWNEECLELYPSYH